MSYPRADEATKTYAPSVVEVSECEGWLQEQADRIEELERDLEIVQAHAERNEAAATRFQFSLAERDEEVAELERREALLTAFVVAYDDWNAGRSDSDDAIFDSRDALDWIPQP
jgi:hypothetical protein